MANYQAGLGARAPPARRANGAEEDPTPLVPREAVIRAPAHV